MGRDDEALDNEEDDPELVVEADCVAGTAASAEAAGQEAIAAYRREKDYEAPTRAQKGTESLLGAAARMRPGDSPSRAADPIRGSRPKIARSRNIVICA